jgi:hypothetical protein
MAGGAPKGNTNAAKSKRLSSVLQARLDERKDEEALMNKLLDMALEGDLPSIKEVFDRVDGKAKQSIDLEATITKRLDELTDEELTAIATSGK